MTSRSGRPQTGRAKTPGSAAGLRLLVLAGAAALAGTAPAGPAAAQTATLTGGGSGGSAWIVANEAGTDGGLPDEGSCDDSPGLGILDATLDPDGAALGDAYDYGQVLYIDGEIFVSANPPGTEVAGGVGTVFPAERQIVNGVDVTVEYRAVGDDATLRTLVRLFNPSEEPIDMTVDFVTNLGSDAATTVEATSSGDATFTTADRWVVTSDGGAGDPVVTHVLHGPGTPFRTPTVVSETVFDCAGSQGILANFEITVPPVGSRLLLFFNQLHAAPAEALDAVTAFDANPAPCSDLVVGMSLQDLDETLNWDFEPSCRSARVNKVALNNNRPKLKWAWKKGEATAVEDFGDPTADTAYRLCLFETLDGRQRFAARYRIPPGAGWKQKKRGFRYKQKDGAPDGITKLKLASGEAGKARLKIRGRDLALPGLPLSQDPELILQLHNSQGVCWEGRLETPPRVNDTSEFKDTDRAEEIP